MAFKKGDRVYFQAPGGKMITGLVVDLKPRVVKNHTGTGLKIALAANQTGKAVTVNVPINSLYETRVEAEKHGRVISKEEKALQIKLKTKATKELIKKMGPIKVGDWVFLGDKIGIEIGVGSIGTGLMKINNIKNGEAEILGARISDDKRRPMGKINIKYLKRRKDKIWVGKEEYFTPYYNPNKSLS